MPAARRNDVFFVRVDKLERAGNIAWLRVQLLLQTFLQRIQRLSLQELEQLVVAG